MQDVFHLLAQITIRYTLCAIETLLIIVEGKNIKINGDGKPIRSYMYLGDMVYWILKILLMEKMIEIIMLALIYKYEKSCM